MCPDTPQGDSPDRKTLRPLRDLLLLLPYLPVAPDTTIQWEAANPDVLVDVSTHAEIVQRVVNLGIAAIGRMLVHTSPEVGGEEFPAESCEALGWLLAELGDLAAVAHCLAASCQRHTADYAPNMPKHVPPARP